MKEIRDIIQAYDAATAAGMQSALASVVKVEGSSYRREGARMLITADGKLTGAISGGCLEGDALRKALLVMEHQSPALVTYDTTDEDDAKLGLGLGCNGIIHILIEPIDPRTTNAIDLLKEAAAKRQTTLLITAFSLTARKAPQQGSIGLFSADGFLAGSPNILVDEPLIAQAREVFAFGKSAILELNSCMVFFEVLKPSVALMVFGAGNDALPLVQMATVLGWEITVVDGRPAYPTKARFPSVHHLLVGKPDDALDQLVFDAQTAVVLMTHNYNYDLAMLNQLLPIDVPYIGVLGPKKKLERMRDELAESGVAYAEPQWEKVHGPTGLDIGALTAEEIALSILAEIQAVLAQKTAGSLRNRELPIHDQKQPIV